MILLENNVLVFSSCRQVKISEKKKKKNRSKTWVQTEVGGGGGAEGDLQANGTYTRDAMACVQG